MEDIVDEMRNLFSPSQIGKFLIFIENVTFELILLPLLKMRFFLEKEKKFQWPKIMA